MNYQLKPIEDIPFYIDDIRRRGTPHINATMLRKVKTKQWQVLQAVF